MRQVDVYKRQAYGTTIDRWTTTDGDHAIRVLPARSAAKDQHKNLLLLSDDTSEHAYTMVEELAPDGYLAVSSTHLPRRTIQVRSGTQTATLSPPLPLPKMDRWTKSGSAPREPLQPTIF